MGILTGVEYDALMLSLKVAICSAVTSLPIAVAVAVVLARHSFPGKSLVDGLVHLPLILPPVVTGYILLLTLGQRGVIGEWLDRVLGIVIAFRWTGAAVASAVMGFPLMVQAIRLSIEGVDRRLEEASSTLGANRAMVFLTVTLPLILPGILAGLILSFARGLGEFGATITFVSNIPGETQTIPLAIYSFTQSPTGDVPALRLTVISVVLSLAALMLSNRLSLVLKRRLQGRTA
ncbi:MAG: molybdate ABC transporter permease subunit [Azospirillaceae bacterium]|nr:molybdate ABC transporter permease subunit [Azospirillaceae bacterium]